MLRKKEKDGKGERMGIRTTIEREKKGTRETKND
jgi:hypothetical protein